MKIKSAVVKLFSSVIGTTIMSPPGTFTLLEILVFGNNLYHRTSPLLMLLSNTQVNLVDDAPSHIVSSSGSLITVVK